MGLKWAGVILIDRAREPLLLLRENIPTIVPHEIGVLQEFPASPYYVPETS